MTSRRQFEDFNNSPPQPQTLHISDKMADKVQGSVKWFSNKKGYGFITPAEGSSVTEDVFVHQSSIFCEGYRTLVSVAAVITRVQKDLHRFAYDMHVLPFVVSNAPQSTPSIFAHYLSYLG